MSEAVGSMGEIDEPRLLLLRDFRSEDDFRSDEFARREAILSFSATSLFPTLKDVVETASNDSVRWFAGRLIIQLWINTRDSSVCAYAVERLLESPKCDRWWRLFDDISELPRAHANRLAELLTPPYRRRWGKVMQILARSNSIDCEEKLLFVLGATKSKWDRIYACETLGHIRSVKSLPLLGELLFAKKGDVAYAATLAAGKILGPQGVDLYRYLYHDASYRHKDVAAHLIVEYGSAPDAPAIVHRVKSMLGRSRGEPPLYSHDHPLAVYVGFLERYASGTDAVRKLYSFIKNHWDRLYHYEREFLVANLADFCDVSWKAPESESSPRANPAGPKNVEQARGLLLFREATFSGVRYDEFAPSYPLVSIILAASGRAERYAEALWHFPDIQELHVRAPDVHDEHLAPLGNMTGLRRLNISNGQITDEGIRLLARITTLEEISLSGCKISDECIPWLLQQRRLRNLSIEGAIITSKGCMELIVPRGQMAHLGDSRVQFGAVRLASILGCKLLQFGMTRNQTRIGKALMFAGVYAMLRTSELIRDVGFTHLSLCDTPLTDDAFEGIEKQVGLEQLRLCATRVGDLTVGRLAPLKRLRLLDLRNTLVTDKGLDFLVHLSPSTTILLSGTRVTEEGFSRFKERYPSADFRSTWPFRFA